MAPGGQNGVKIRIGAFGIHGKRAAVRRDERKQFPVVLPDLVQGKRGARLLPRQVPCRQAIYRVGTAPFIPKAPVAGAKPPKAGDIGTDLT